MCGEAGKTDTGGWAMAFIPIIAVFTSALFIKLHEKLFDNIKASISLIICNIIIACILQKFLDCNGIIYFLMSFIAVSISIMIVVGILNYHRLEYLYKYNICNYRVKE